MKNLWPIAAIAIMLAGCSSAPDPVATTEPEGPSSANQVYCDTYSKKMQEYADYLAGIGAEMSGAEARAWITWADGLDSVTPDDAAQITADYLSPIRQIEEVLNAGGGNLNLQLTSFKTSTTKIMQYCVDAGWRVKN